MVGSANASSINSAGSEQANRSTDSKHTGSEQTDPKHTGSEQADPKHTGSEQADPKHTGRSADAGQTDRSKFEFRLCDS
jgi:hypothetical protein